MKFSKENNLAIIAMQKGGVGGVYRVMQILQDDLKLKVYDLTHHLEKEGWVNRLRFILHLLFLRPKEQTLVFLTINSIFLNIIYRKRFIYYINGIKYFHAGKPALMESIQYIVWKAYIRRVASKGIILCCSNCVRTRLLELTGISAGLLYPPIDTHLFKQGKDKGYFFAAGRFVEYKNFIMLIRLFKKLPQKRLIIAGDGPLLGQYLEIMQQENIQNVKIIVKPSQRTLVRLYSHCTSLIFPSLNEHFGMVPLEAMASGKAAICHRSGGPLEYIQEGENGFLFSNEPELLEIIANVKKTRIAKRILLDTAERFSRKRFSKQFKVLIKNENIDVE